MYRLRRKQETAARPIRREHCGVLSRARGITLAEIIMAMMITSMLAVVMGGITSAVQTARVHVEGVEEATLQAEAAIERRVDSLRDAAPAREETVPDAAQRRGLQERNGHGAKPGGTGRSGWVMAMALNRLPMA